MKGLPNRTVLDLATDMARGPGLLMAFVVVASVLLLRGSAGPGDGDAALKALHVVVDQTSLIFVLVLTNRIVSGDRDSGYYRAYFAKPVDPVVFYLAKWIVGLLALLLFALVMSVALGVIFRTVPFDAPMLGQLAMQYGLGGGLILLLSTVIRQDGIVAAVVVAVQSILHGLTSQMGADLGLQWRVLHGILPPFYLASPGQPLPVRADLAHVLLYAAGLVVAACVVIRLRPMGSGGRS
jgi:hypothetical protein